MITFRVEIKTSGFGGIFLLQGKEIGNMGHINQSINDEREYFNDQFEGSGLEKIARKLEKTIQDPKHIDLKGIKKAIRELYSHAWEVRTRHDPS